MLGPLALDPTTYPDRPSNRADDWSGRLAPPVPVATVEQPAGDAGSGGLSRELRHRRDSKKVKRDVPEQLDLLGLGEDEDQSPVDPSSLLGSVTAAHGINEGQGHHNLLPSF